MDVSGFRYVTGTSNLQIRITARIRNFQTSVREAAITSNIYDVASGVFHSMSPVNSQCSEKPCCYISVVT